jgi:hypothetical protein
MAEPKILHDIILKISPIKCWLFLILFILCATTIFCFTGEPMDQTVSNNLEQGFITPPQQARPQVMWWWLNSYISKEGVTRDLEAMKEQGIGGALIFDAAPVDRWRPKNVKPVPVGPPFLSPAWRDVFRHAIKEAARLDLELGVSITSGFNAGGPWVTPDYGQQEIVWSEIMLKGPSSYSGKLPLPSGPIYDNNGELISYSELDVNNDLFSDQKGRPIHYRDVALLAVPFTPTAGQIPGKYAPSDAPPGRLKHWALKSVHSFNYPENNGYLFDINYDNGPDLSNEPRIESRSIINLSDQLDQDGQLQWDIPEGKWLILRFGHTHTGIRLQATNPQNEGLAMNHLSASAANKHFEEIGEKLIEDIGRVGEKSLTYFYLDSWEVRIANWTEEFIEEFYKRRGYDMTPYLPVLSGCIVDSRDISNRFLHDYRQTIGDCIADNYYGQFQRLSHDHGLDFRSEMATTPIPVDMLKCLGRCDIPFGEFWAESDLNEGRIEPWERMFGKQAASAAHTYGKNLVSAEALTVAHKHWEHGPFELKRTVDQAFCSGINRLMIHTFTHSPPDVGPPGYEYFAGTHFNPQITWWKQSHAFTNYISRCQFLLQQGKFVADVCFYQGDRIPSFVPMKHIDPGLGPGFDYDVVNSEALLTRMSVQDGKIVLPDGMSYRLLVLPDTDMINPRVLKKIAELVQSGATVIGPKPNKAYGLKDYPIGDSTVKKMAESLWGACDGKIIKEKTFGNGRIICGKTAREILLDQGILPDFEFKSPLEDTNLDYIHRSVLSSSVDTDIYFIANLSDRWENVTCTFRVKDRIPEIWKPESGKINDAAVYEVERERTTMPLYLSPLGSVFIVFRKMSPRNHITAVSLDSNPVFPPTGLKADNGTAFELYREKESGLILNTKEAGNFTFINNEGSHFNIQMGSIPPPIPVPGPWIVRFPKERGAPDSVVFNHLISWTESMNPGIKYFSGTATYHTSFEIKTVILGKGHRLYLDLGSVKNIAEISLNGESLGIFWTPPFQTDITTALKPGVNHLTIGITNLWPNRLIGDQFLPADERIAFTNIHTFTKKSPLLESGLLGPVKIIFISRTKLKL